MELITSYQARLQADDTRIVAQSRLREWVSRAHSENAATRITITSLDTLSTDAYQQLCLRASPDRQARSQTYRKFVDQMRCLVAGELLNYALRTYHGLNEHPTLVTNKFGKPEMTSTPKIEYNLAHGGRFVVCATSDRPVGIDVEAARTNNIASVLPEFAPDEIEKINSLSDTQRRRACIKVWSQKEAYLKYLGIGLNIPLNSFSVYDRSTLVSFPGASEKVEIRSWEIATDSHILSVCSEGGAITISNITESELLASKFPKSSG